MPTLKNPGVKLLHFPLLIMKSIVPASNAAVQYEEYITRLGHGLPCQHVSEFLHVRGSTPSTFIKDAIS